jgi:hypothetical protein
MTHTGGRVFATTAGLAGAAGIAYNLTWAVLWLAIVIAMFDTVFQLIRAVGEGPSRGSRRAPIPGRQTPPAIDLR